MPNNLKLHITTGRNRRPFPNPVIEAIELLSDQTIARWLEWQSTGRSVADSVQLALTLATETETHVRTRRLWTTWDKYDAAIMQESLRVVGVTVENGAAFNLPTRILSLPMWFLPAVAGHQPAPPQTPQTLLQVFSGDHHAQ